jgi:hypothetical protein
VFRSDGSFRGLLVFFPQKRHSSSNSHPGRRRGLPRERTDPGLAPPRLLARRPPSRPRRAVRDGRRPSARAQATRTRCRSVRYPLRNTRLPLGQVNAQRCAPCKNQTPDNGRNCSRSVCGSAATSSPTIPVVPSAAEPRHRRDRAGATGTGGSSTSRRNPSEFGVTHWRHRRAVHNEPSEMWPRYARSYDARIQERLSIPHFPRARESPFYLAPSHPVPVIGRARRLRRRGPRGRSGCRPA